MADNCLIFDIGKTYKRVCVFSGQWDLIWSEKHTILNTLDEDGEYCEDINAITSWLINTKKSLLEKGLTYKAVNFSSFGGGLVHLDKNFQIACPLYSYFKSIPFKIKADFEVKYGSENNFYLDAASPNLGMLNLGLQLFWLKSCKPEIYKNIAYSLPLAQYLSFLFSGEIKAEISQIGAHSLLWNYKTADYLDWTKYEELSLIKYKPVSSDTFILKNDIAIGVGIQGGTAALLPYLKYFKEPFIFISSGSWSLTLNAFAHDDITEEELNSNCFYFSGSDFKTIKTARIYSGSEHDRQVKHLASCFNKPENYFKQVNLQPEIIKNLRKNASQALPIKSLEKGLIESPFTDRTIQEFKSFDEAYHQLMLDMVAQHMAAIELVADRMPIKNIVIEGLFTKSKIFIDLLKESCFNRNVYVSKLEQSSAWGAALVIEKAWKPESFIEMKKPQFLFETGA